MADMTNVVGGSCQFSFYKENLLLNVKIAKVDGSSKRICKRFVEA